MNERLYRSVDDRVIAGVCGGLAARLALDPSLVRVVWAVLALVTGIFPLLVVYVIMAAVVPEDPKGFAGTWPSPTPPAPSLGPRGTRAAQKRRRSPRRRSRRTAAADPVAATGAGAPGPAAPPTPGTRAHRRRAGPESGGSAILSSAIIGGLALVALGAYLPRPRPDRDRLGHRLGGRPRRRGSRRDHRRASPASLTVGCLARRRCSGDR